MFLDLTSWWEGLILLEKIYWGIAIPFSVFFSLQLIMTFFGGDFSDADVDTEIESDTGVEFQFFTLKNLIAFFTIFGWTGIACLDSGYSESNSLIFATVAGLIMMVIMGSIFYLLSKANEQGNVKLINAIGCIGEVYTTIQAQRGNIGKIQIQVQGSYRTLEALTDDDIDLTQGQVITVTAVTNNNLLIVTKSQA